MREINKNICFRFISTDKDTNFRISQYSKISSWLCPITWGTLSLCGQLTSRCCPCPGCWRSRACGSPGRSRTARPGCPSSCRFPHSSHGRFCTRQFKTFAQTNRHSFRHAILSKLYSIAYQAERHLDRTFSSCPRPSLLCRNPGPCCCCC